MIQECAVDVQQALIGAKNVIESLEWRFLLFKKSFYEFFKPGAIRQAEFLMFKKEVNF